MASTDPTSLRRGLAILLAIAGEEALRTAPGVTRIAALIGSDKSQVSRSLRSSPRAGSSIAIRRHSVRPRAGRDRVARRRHSLRGGNGEAPRDASGLYARVAASRERGFVLVDEEFEVGLVAAAAPVRDFGGRIVAAVNVSAPKFRFAKKLARAGKQVRVAAEELSTALGWDAGRQDDRGQAASGA